MSAFVLSLHAQVIPGCSVTLSVIMGFRIHLDDSAVYPRPPSWRDMEVRAHLAQAGKDSGSLNCF